MTIVQPAHATAHGRQRHRPEPRAAAPLVPLLAAGAGLAVASLYYSQPMLGVLEAPTSAPPPRPSGFVPTLTQLGYALGILLLAPLGDRYDRRSIILGEGRRRWSRRWCSPARRPSIRALLDREPRDGPRRRRWRRTSCPPPPRSRRRRSRGRVVGTVMTGLLLGILLSRRGQRRSWPRQVGWRAMFFGAARRASR